MKSFLKLKSVVVLSVLFVFTSCGSQQPMVSDLNVESNTVNSEILVSLDATLNLGNVLLSDITLPIIGKNSGQIGEISMYTNLEGKNKFEIEINLSAIANIQTVVAQLPNGNVLPLIRENNVIVIPVEDKAHVYLAFSEGVAALGASIAIKGLDGVGASTGTASIFPIFNFDGVLGAAGLYTSKEAGKNGFGLFVDLSSVIDPGNLLPFRGARTAAAAGAAIQQREAVQLNYSSIKPSRRKKRRMDRKLLRLHRRRAVL